MKVSVTIIARDAQKWLPGCLKSIGGLTDDVVVVVDDRTTDDTARIAGNFKARVFMRNFDNFAGQKNYALSRTGYRWVLSLDADETASETLVRAIASLPETPPFCAYRIPRKNKIWGRYIEHSNWDPDGLIRLFDKTRCRWSGEVHEEIIPDGITGNLYDPIYHDNYRSVAEFLSRQNGYSSLAAKELAKKGVGFSYIQLFWQPEYEFLRRFVIHAGFLDGFHGLFLSYLMAIYRLSLWIKLWPGEKSPQY
jgi:glycosyltransferase involved in cell wall biosynthesis